MVDRFYPRSTSGLLQKRVHMQLPIDKNLDQISELLSLLYETDLQA